MEYKNNTITERERERAATLTNVGYETLKKQRQSYQRWSDKQEVVMYACVTTDNCYGDSLTSRLTW